MTCDDSLCKREFRRTLVDLPWAGGDSLRVRRATELAEVMWYYHGFEVEEIVANGLRRHRAGWSSDEARRVEDEILKVGIRSFIQKTADKWETIDREVDGPKVHRWFVAEVGKAVGHRNLLAVVAAS